MKINKTIAVAMALTMASAGICTPTMSSITKPQIVANAEKDESDFEIDIKSGLLTAYKGTDSDVVIPSEINGVYVEGISKDAFAGHTDIKSVVIPISVKIIEDGAFEGCTELVIFAHENTEGKKYAKENGIKFNSLGLRGDEFICNIVDYSGKIGENITWENVCGGYLVLHGTGEMGDYAEGESPISKNKDLIISKVYILDGITSVGSYAFSGIDAGSVSLADSVVTIGAGAFCNCRKIDFLTISENVTAIGEKAFFGCSGLDGVYIPSNVTEIGKDAFAECGSGFVITGYENTAAQKYAEENKIRFNSLGEVHDESTLIDAGVCGENVTWKLHNDGTLIISGEGDMYSYTWDRSIYDDLDYSPFYGNSAIKNIIIEKGVTSIGSDAFCGCMNLETVKINESVKKIDSGAFMSCDNLTEITIPNGVESIGDSAFYCCKNMKSADISDTVQTIGNYAFYGCESMEEVSVPESVTFVGSSAFSCCGKLKSVTVPNSETKIGQGAFSYCSEKLVIRCKEGSAALNHAVANKLSFELITDEDTSNRFEFDAETGTITKYMGTGGDVVIPSEIDGVAVKGIGNEAFYNTVYSGYVKSVTIPDGVTEIGELAFSGCNELTTVKIADSVASIGESAFSYCENLTSVSLPKKITKISDKMFENCKYLESVEIPESVTSIGNSAFSECMNLISVTIPEKVESIGEKAFYNAGRSKGAFKSINIPASVASIGEYAFNSRSLKTITVSEDNKNFCDIDGVLLNKDKTELIQYPLGREEKEYTVPDSVKKIGEHSFYGERNLESVVISEGVTVIGKSAFAGIPLKSIVLPASLTDIEESAFSGCKQLSSVTMSEGIKNIGDYAFNYCSELESVTIPESVTAIGEKAFGYGNDDGFTIIYNPIIIGYKGSEAERYAKENDFDFYEVGNVPNYTVKGDANDDGELTIADAVAILQYLANSSKYPLSEQGVINADVDGEGGVTGLDAFKIQQFDARVIDKV